MHTYGGKPLLMRSTSLQLPGTVSAACLKGDHNQQHQLQLIIAVKVLKEVARWRVVKVIKTEHDDATPHTLIARLSQNFVCCQQQQQME